MSLFVFFISLLIVAQHVSGNHVPIIRSWRMRDVIALCWYVPWLQGGCQDRLVGSASMDIVHFYSLHVSGSHVPIIRRIVASIRHLVYVSLCRWAPGKQEHMLLHTSHLHRLFLFSKCFGQPCAHHQENYCINTTRGLCHCVQMTVWYAGAYAPA